MPETHPAYWSPDDLDPIRPQCASVGCRKQSSKSCASCDADLCEDCAQVDAESGEFFCGSEAETPCAHAEYDRAQSMLRAAAREYRSPADLAIDAEGMALRTGWAEAAIDRADLARKADA